MLLIYGLCGINAGLSLLASVAHEQFAGAIILLFCFGAWIGIQHLGYTEFDAVRRMVLGGTFRRLLNAQRQLVTFRDGLATAATPDQCWEVLHHAYSDFGFNEITLKLADDRWSVRGSAGRYAAPPSQSALPGTSGWKYTMSA